MTIELIEIAMAVMFVLVWMLAADITFREKPPAEPLDSAPANSSASNRPGLHAREKLRNALSRRAKSNKRQPK